MLRIDNLIDDAKCYQSVRQLRWPDGLRCVWCQSDQIKRRGLHQRQRERQRYHCQACGRDFDDLTNTVFAHHHQPLRKWVLSLYFMGLNLSNEQIAQELDLDKDDVQQMTAQLRSGVVALKPEPQLAGTVECDEVYIVAGHKGHPEAGKKKGAPGDAAR
jgi:transposase-like protein